MQVVDLRPGRRAAPRPLRVWASPAAELVRATAALTDNDWDGFDVGDDRLGELRDHLDDGLRARLRTGPTENWLLVTSLVALLDEPGTVVDLFALLTEDPPLVWRALVEPQLAEHETYDPAVLDAFLAGEVDLEALTAHIDALPGDGSLRESVDPYLAEDPATYALELHAALRDVHDSVGAAMLAEAIGPMEREVLARRRQLEEGLPVSDLVVEATNGYELTDDLPIDDVLLLPSYWFRPWLIINRQARTEVLTSPVADEHLALPSAAPSPALVKLCKALGDEGRLRLLRRMTGGPITLADAMGELDVAKTTAHHHLATLRQAGLVVIRGQGRDSRYALRVHPSSAMSSALDTYLGSSATVSVGTTG